ncbi:MAG: sensor histidine kinase [Calditrichaeota bacterium]|nr:MAG: sensor histidine kinase [Calditrichota bacterium]
MKKLKNISLLTKTTLIYLGVTFFAFFIVSIFIAHEVDTFIEKELDYRFSKEERKISHFIKKGKRVHLLKPYSSVLSVENSSAEDFSPVYCDTLLLNIHTEEIEHYRKKITVINVNGKNYKLQMMKSIEDFDKLRNNIFALIIPAFILLAVGIVCFNFFLSGFLFQPFNRILAQMQSYQTGQKIHIEKQKTTTSEFVKMQRLFHYMLERVDKDYRNLKEYTENMAHEIKTPLAVILNKTESLISDEKIMEKQAKAVKTIYDEVNHLTRLGNVLNLLTKIENNEFNNSRRVGLREIIEHHVEAVRELIELKSMSIELDLSDKHSINIDPFLLDIIIKNLLRNAIRYGNINGKIRICTEEGKFSVGNEGEPLTVPSEILFKRFYRKDNSNGSLGLGLALVKEICELSNLQVEYFYQSGQHVFSISENKEQKLISKNLDL